MFLKSYFSKSETIDCHVAFIFTEVCNKNKLSSCLFPYRCDYIGRCRWGKYKRPYIESLSVNTNSSYMLDLVLCTSILSDIDDSLSVCCLWQYITFLTTLFMFVLCQTKPRFLPPTLPKGSVVLCRKDHACTLDVHYSNASSFNFQRSWYTYT